MRMHGVQPRHLHVPLRRDARERVRVVRGDVDGRLGAARRQTLHVDLYTCHTHAIHMRRCTCVCMHGAHVRRLSMCTAMPYGESRGAASCVGMPCTCTGQPDAHGCVHARGACSSVPCTHGLLGERGDEAGARDRAHAVVRVVGHEEDVVGHVVDRDATPVGMPCTGHAHEVCTCVCTCMGGMVEPPARTGCRSTRAGRGRPCARRARCRRGC